MIYVFLNDLASELFLNQKSRNFDMSQYPFLKHTYSQPLELGV